MALLAQSGNHGEEDHEDDHRPQRRKEADLASRHLEPLREKNGEERATDRHVDRVHREERDREQRPARPKDPRNIAYRFDDERGERGAARLAQTDLALIRLRRDRIENDELRRHGYEGEQVDRAHRGDELEALDEKPGEGRDEPGDDSRDMDPGPEVHDLAGRRVLDEQARPRRHRDAQHGVHDRSHVEPGRVLRECPDERGDAPRDRVEDERRALSAELVCNGAAEDRCDHLQRESDRRDQTDRLLGHAEREHVHGGERRVEIERNAPQRLGVHAGPGVAAGPEERRDQRMA